MSYRLTCRDIIAAMRIIFVAALSGCAVAPIKYSPRLPKSGIRIGRGEQAAIFAACGGTHNHTDSGKAVKWSDDYAACWDKSTKTIYAEDSCRGAKATALHERAHEEGVKDPEKEGYDWSDK